MKLLWQIDTQVDPRYLSLMQTAADCALWMEGVSRPCAVNIRICGDDAIHEINREYRGVDRATDVLSFPTVNYPAGKTAGQCDKLLARELDDEVDACMLGDLIISMPHLLAQAAEYGHSPEREAAYLTVHGLCHLMGYDHIEDEDKKKMRAMEEKILSAIGMTRDGETQTFPTRRCWKWRGRRCCGAIHPIPAIRSARRCCARMGACFRAATSRTRRSA